MKSFTLSVIFATFLSSTVLAGFEEGVAAIAVEDMPLAFEEFRASAEQGHIDSQYNLGLMYEQGIGVGKDERQTIVWYRKSAAQGDALAIGNLGMLYMRGQGVQQNKVVGLALLLQSATMDNSPENRARQNVAMIKGLTAKMIAEA